MELGGAQRLEFGYDLPGDHHRLLVALDTDGHQLLTSARCASMAVCTPE